MAESSVSIASVKQDLLDVYNEISQLYSHDDVLIMAQCVEDQQTDKLLFDLEVTPAHFKLRDLANPFRLFSGSSASIRNSITFTTLGSDVSLGQIICQLIENALPTSSNAKQISSDIWAAFSSQRNKSSGSSKNLEHAELEEIVKCTLTSQHINSSVKDELQKKISSIVPATKVFKRFSMEGRRAECIRGRKDKFTFSSGGHVVLYIHNSLRPHRKRLNDRTQKFQLGSQTILDAVEHEFGCYVRQALVSRKFVDTGMISIGDLKKVRDFCEPYKHLPKAMLKSISEKDGAFNCRIDAADIDLINKKWYKFVTGEIVKKCIIRVEKNPKNGSFEDELAFEVCTPSKLDINRAHVCLTKINNGDNIIFDGLGKEPVLIWQKLSEHLCSQCGAGSINKTSQQYQLGIVGSFLNQQLFMLFLSNILGDNSGFILKQPPKGERSNEDQDLSYISSQGTTTVVPATGLKETYFIICVDSNCCTIKYKSTIHFSIFSANRGLGPSCCLFSEELQVARAELFATINIDLAKARNNEVDFSIESVQITLDGQLDGLYEVDG